LNFSYFSNLQQTDPVIADKLIRKLIDKVLRKYSKNAIELWTNRGWWTSVELDMKKSKTAIGRMVIASRKMNLSLCESNNQLKRFIE